MFDEKATVVDDFDEDGTLDIEKVHQVRLVKVCIF